METVVEFRAGSCHLRLRGRGKAAWMPALEEKPWEEQGW